MENSKKLTFTSLDEIEKMKIKKVAKKTTDQFKIKNLCKTENIKSICEKENEIGLIFNGEIYITDDHKNFTAKDLRALASLIK